MAFGIRYCVAILETVALVVRPAEVVAVVTHAGLLVVGCGIGPQHEPRGIAILSVVIREFKFLTKVAPVLEDHVHRRVLVPDVVAVFLQPSNSLGAVSAIHALLLDDALREVPPESVDVVVLHPVVEVALDKFTRFGTSVIPIVEPRGAVRCACVEPRIVGENRPVFPVHGDEGVGLVCMVVHHVQNHGNPTLVAGVHQGLEVVFGAIGLVDGEVKRGIVSPTVVAIELVDRHQFECLNAQPLEVVERVLNECQRTLFRPVAHQQFVDHEVLLVRPFEISVRPCKLRLAGRQDAHRPRGFVGRIGQEIGVSRFWNPGVVPLVQDDLRVGVGHPDVVGEDLILVSVRFTWRQSANLQPERFAISCGMHHAGLRDSPTVPIPDHKHKILVRCGPLKHHRAVIQLIDAIHDPCWWGQHRRTFRHHKHRGGGMHSAAICTCGNVQDVIPSVVQAQGVGERGAKCRRDLLAIDAQGKFSGLGGLRHNVDAFSQRGDGGRLQRAGENDFKGTVGDVVKDVALVCRFAYD